MEPGSAPRAELPRAATEEALAAVWAEVLGVERVGMEDNFFDLGGTSVLVLRVHEALRERLGLDVAVVDLFRFTTVRALADHLGGGAAREREQTTRAAQEKADSRRELRGRRRDVRRGR